MKNLEDQKSLADACLAAWQEIVAERLELLLKKPITLTLSEGEMTDSEGSALLLSIMSVRKEVKVEEIQKIMAAFVKWKQDGAIWDGVLCGTMSPSYDEGGLHLSIGPVGKRAMEAKQADA